MTVSGKRLQLGDLTIFDDASSKMVRTPLNEEPKVSSDQHAASHTAKPGLLLSPLWSV